MRKLYRILIVIGVIALCGFATKKTANKRMVRVTAPPPMPDGSPSRIASRLDAMPAVVVVPRTYVLSFQHAPAASDEVFGILTRDTLTSPWWQLAVTTNTTVTFSDPRTQAYFTAYASNTFTHLVTFAR